MKVLPTNRVAAIIFVVVSGVYALLSWEAIFQPSSHFHFVDMAHSFLDGRLDTETPHRSRKQVQEMGEPRGIADAVERATTGSDGAKVGWNDWASYYEIQLRETGETFRGVWPWKDLEGRKNEFHTLDGTIRFVDRDKDIARNCADLPRKKCLKKVYQVSFPPFPALVMLPPVLLWGYDTNDVLITVLFGGLNAVLLFFWLLLLVRRGYTTASQSTLLWLTAFFALGTALCFSSVRGEVWFTALVLGCTFHLLFLMAALDAKHPWLAGIALACGFATRTPLVFASVFYGLQVFFPASGEPRELRDGLQRIFKFAIPCVVVGVSLLVINWIRWESPTEFGHTYLAEGTRASIRDYGLFHPHFVERNLRVLLTYLPTFSSEAPYLSISKHGLGLFVSSPLLLWAFLSRRWGRLQWALLATLIVVVVPAVFYQNTGWEQFAFRFSIDWLPLMMGLILLHGKKFGTLEVTIIVYSIVVNVFGAVIFGRFPGFFSG